MVDKARAVYEVEDPSQAWHEGQPFAEQQLGPSFRCRLTVELPTEGLPARSAGVGSRGYRYLQGTAQLIMLTVYEDGSSVTAGLPGHGAFLAFQDGQMLLITSTADEGDGVWHVVSGIQPIRKLRKVIGFHCTLRRAREPLVVEGELPPEGEAEPPPPVVGVPAVKLLGGADEPEEYSD